MLNLVQRLSGCSKDLSHNLATTYTKSWNRRLNAYLEARSDEDINIIKILVHQYSRTGYD